MRELKEQMKEREEHLQKLIQLGVDPYPHRYAYDMTPQEVHRVYGTWEGKVLEEAHIHLKVPGRIMQRRKHGKVVFIDIADGITKLQLFVGKKQVDPKTWEILPFLDLGDQVGAEGTLFRTRMGELTLLVEKLTFLAKCLKPLPEKYHGLQDIELRQRKRYLDLLVNPESHRVFQLRAKIIGEIRKFFDKKGYVEVETPMMQVIPGGATAKPFKTYHNALDLPLYLRIAPELYLKKLVVGGMLKVYEINRNFRNEGISRFHNPEFTMLEFYEAYQDYEYLMALTEELLQHLALTIHGKTTLTYQGHTIDLTPPFQRISLLEAVERFCPHHPDPHHQAALVACARELEIPSPETLSVPQLLLEIFEKTVEETLIAPTFVTGFPREVSPLAKGDPQQPVVHRFELFIGGLELANAYCELNDPIEQRRRMEAQVQGDSERTIDEDFLEALSYGLPPTAGEGIGIDRLVMLLADQASIRDVLLFPLLRPR